MVNKSYQKGARFEYEVKDFLEDKDYIVMRSAGSHSDVDLVAIKPHFRPLVIQCKYNKKMARKNMRNFGDKFNWCGVRPIVAYREKYARQIEFINPFKGEVANIV